MQIAQADPAQPNLKEVASQGQATKEECVGDRLDSSAQLPVVSDGCKFFGSMKKVLGFCVIPLLIHLILI